MMIGSPWPLQRLGIVMQPDPADPREAEGVLNPAVARGPDGQLYLLPRLVAPGNYSRIGLARVVFDRHNTPVGVERLGLALEPQEPYERNAHSGGGVEDPRITHLAARGLYVMTYTALGPAGPRIAAALSRNLMHWHRTGLVQFAPLHSLDLATVDNKDALLFPEPMLAPDGRPALALIHRPTFKASLPGVRDPRPSMWISYAPLDEHGPAPRLVFGQHRLLAAPQQGWESLKVGGGAPPVWTRKGWLVLYHGVSGVEWPHSVRYCAGVLLLDRHDPRRVLYRSAHSVLEPRLAAEHDGVVPQVVFPTGVDVQLDGALDVYYGMADSRIGVARARSGMVPAPAPARAAHGQGRPTQPNGELRAGPGLPGKAVHVNSIARNMIATLMTARHRRST